MNRYIFIALEPSDSAARKGSRWLPLSLRGGGVEESPLRWGREPRLAAPYKEAVNAIPSFTVGVTVMVPSLTRQQNCQNLNTHKEG